MVWLLSATVVVLLAPWLCRSWTRSTKFVCSPDFKAFLLNVYLLSTLESDVMIYTLAIKNACCGGAPCTYTQLNVT